MKIAITLWGDRVSPVLESSGQLLIIKAEHGQVLDREILPIAPANLESLLLLLHRQRVDLLLCGALCSILRTRVEELGVRVQPFVTGRVAPLLERVLENREIEDFVMPGCRWRGCCRHPERNFPGKD